MTVVYMVLVETASNQDYVFQSNKLREIVGASWLIRSVGTDWALQAAAKAGMGSGDKPFADMTTRERIAFVDTAQKIDKGAEVEPVVCTSGKALFLVADRKSGEAIIEAVTLRALRDAPSLVVRGIVSEAFDLAASAEDAARNVGDLFRAIERLRLALPPAEGRFPFQPIIEPCRTTGLPAERAENRQPLSASGHAKRNVVEKAIAVASRDLDVGLVGNTDELDKALGLDWMAAVHADGNGFGQVFMNLQAYCTGANGAAATGRDYFDLYRELSASLDLVGVHALKQSLDVLKTSADRKARKSRKTDTDSRKIPLVVIVMGGDDLTVLCDGASAVDFVADYLRAFDHWVEQQTIDGRPNVIPNLRQPSEPRKKFGAAAGIAIVKPHHPVHQAFDLAEELTKSAKTLTKHRFKMPGLSSLDYQVVFGDATSNLTSLRESWSFDDGQVLAHARPYVVSPPEGDSKVERRHIDRLVAAQSAIRQKDQSNSPLYPRSQQHALREAVLAGDTIADARLALLAHRYDKVAWRAFGGDESTLYFDVDSVKMTRLIDAMELVDINKDGPADDSEPSATGETEKVA